MVDKYEKIDDKKFKKIISVETEIDIEQVLRTREAHVQYLAELEEKYLEQKTHLQQAIVEDDALIAEAKALGVE